MIITIDKYNKLFQGFFPGLIHVAYVLRPAGFFQKAISEVSNKLFKDEFKFKVIIFCRPLYSMNFMTKIKSRI